MWLPCLSLIYRNNKKAMSHKLIFIYQPQVHVGNGYSVPTMGFSAILLHLNYTFSKLSCKWTNAFYSILW